MDKFGAQIVTDLSCVGPKGVQSRLFVVHGLPHLVPSDG